MLLTRTLTGASLIIASAALAGTSPDIAFTNGRWFNGTSFEPRTVVTSKGRLRAVHSLPSKIRTIDLSGGFVVPPFCEAHNHNIGVGKPSERNAKYFRSGVFYAQILNDSPDVVATEQSFWNQANSVDVAFAHGGITGIGGHPVEVLEGIRRGGGFPAGTVLKDRAYFEVGSPEELDAKWPLLLKEQPDIVKVFLQFSEEYEKRKDDPAYFGNRGVSPAVFRHAVELAHRAHRRIAVHVTSAQDFHLAVDAGADIIAHLPGYMSVERISPDDARTAARKQIIVITTASLAQTYPVENVAREDLKIEQIANLKLLKSAGVNVVVGSDNYGDSSPAEVAYLRTLGVYSDLELLRMWTGACPRSIFPARKVGTLENGADANFLVLEGNPLDDFNQTRHITLMVKDGQPVRTTQ